MGKSANGAVWLNGEDFSPYDFWQYWRNTEDADVERFLKIFTRLPLDEIARLAALGGAEINEAKKVLATEATAIVHGRAAAEAAEDRAQDLRGWRARPSLPSIEIAADELAAGIGMLRAGPTGLAASNGEARRTSRAERYASTTGRSPTTLVVSTACYRRRRRQAVAGQEEARAGAAGLKLFI